MISSAAIVEKFYTMFPTSKKIPATLVTEWYRLTLKMSEDEAWAIIVWKEAQELANTRGESE